MKEREQRKERIQVLRQCRQRYNSKENVLIMMLSSHMTQYRFRGSVLTAIEEREKEVRKILKENNKSEEQSIKKEI